VGILRWRGCYALVLEIAVGAVAVVEHNKLPMLGLSHCRPLPMMNLCRAVDTGKDLSFRIYKNTKFVLGYMPY
jgi:hypothetical protein